MTSGDIFSKEPIVALFPPHYWNQVSPVNLGFGFLSPLILFLVKLDHEGFYTHLLYVD